MLLNKTRKPDCNRTSNPVIKGACRSFKAYNDLETVREDYGRLTTLPPRSGRSPFYCFPYRAVFAFWRSSWNTEHTRKENIEPSGVVCEIIDGLKNWEI